MSAQPFQEATTAAHLQALHSIRELMDIAAKRRSLLRMLDRPWAGSDEGVGDVLMGTVYDLEDSAGQLLEEIDYALGGLDGADVVCPSSGMTGGSFPLPDDMSGLLLAGYAGGDLVLVNRDRRVIVMSGRPAAECIKVYRLDLKDYDDIVVDAVPRRAAVGVRDSFSGS